MQLEQIDFELDPTGHYEEMFPDDFQVRVIEALGILPQFTAGPHESMAQNMQENYTFFYNWSAASDHGAYIEDDCFCFPGDPAIYPLMKAEYGEETIHIYPNAVVCVSTEGDLLKWTRMD